MSVPKILQDFLHLAGPMTSSPTPHELNGSVRPYNPTPPRPIPRRPRANTAPVSSVSHQMELDMQKASSPPLKDPGPSSSSDDGEEEGTSAENWRHVPPDTPVHRSRHNGMSVSDLPKWTDDDPPVEGDGRKPNKKGQTVSFPPDPDIVSGYHEPPKPHPDPSKTSGELNLHEILQAYVSACKKYKVPPSTKVEKQISNWHMRANERQDLFSLKGEKVKHVHMECLEEIFRRVQFVAVDFEYCFLDDDAVVALCDMVEYYDSTHRLNLSFNQHIGPRGWQALFRTLRKNPCIEHLNLRYTSLNERSIPLLARALRMESSLSVLHLENCSMSGKPMLLLACALKPNSSMKELYLAENNLGPGDAAHLYQLITGNTSIHLLDLRNNALQDSGLSHICDALRSPAAREKSALNTLVLWNNKITAAGMKHMGRALLENKTLQTLNMGCNTVGNEGMSQLKDALARNRSLLRLGLQATKLNCQGAIIVAECIADNPTLVRVDLRDNPEIKTAGLLALHLALKMNHSITALNLDKSCYYTAKGQDYGEQFRKIYEEIHDFCDRNRHMYEAKLIQELQKRSEEEETAAKQEEPANEAEVDTVLEACHCTNPLNYMLFDSETDERVVTDQEEETEVPKPSEVDASRSEVILRPNSLPNELTYVMTRPPFVRAPSLTCHDDVTAEDFKLLFGKYLGFQAREKVIQLISTIEDTEGEALAEQTPPEPTPPVIVVELPKRNKVNRFRVSSVDRAVELPKEPVLPGFVTPPRQTSRDSLPQYVESDGCKFPTAAESPPPPPLEESEGERQKVVRSVLEDLVTFCVYEIGDYAHTPSVSRSRARLYADFAEASAPVVESRPTEEVDEAVNAVVRDLVRDCLKLERDRVRNSVRQKRKKLAKQQLNNHE